MRDCQALNVSHGINAHSRDDVMHNARVHMALGCQFFKFSNRLGTIQSLSCCCTGLFPKACRLEKSNLRSGFIRGRWQTRPEVCSQSRRCFGRLQGSRSAYLKRSRQGRPATNGVEHFEKIKKGFQKPDQTKKKIKPPLEVY